MLNVPINMSSRFDALTVQDLNPIYKAIGIGFVCAQGHVMWVITDKKTDSINAFPKKKNCQAWAPDNWG